MPIPRQQQDEPGRLIPFPLAEEGFLTLVRGRPCDGLGWSPSTRILTLFDASDQGKSSLLLRLKHRCKFPENRARGGVPPIALIDFKMEVKDKIDFCGRLQKQLADSEIFLRAVREIEIEHPGTSAPEDPRESAFDRARARPRRTQSNGNSAVSNAAKIGLESTEIKDSLVTAQINAGRNVYINAVPPRFDDDERLQQTGLSRYLQQKADLERVAICLKRTSKKRPVILLVDHWEKSAPELRDWVINEFLGPIALCTKWRLFVVIAGKGLPPVFDHLSPDWSRYVGVLPGIQKTWTPATLGEYLLRNGIVNPDFQKPAIQEWLFDDLPNQGLYGMVDWIRKKGKSHE